MKEKVFIVISDYFSSKIGGDYTVNKVTKNKDDAIKELNSIKENELHDNSFMWEENNIYSKEESPDYFFIMNNDDDWVEIKIIEKEID